MTPAEALPYHLCLRLGVLHPDELYVRLTARQLQDWYRFHQQHCIAVGRDDPFWATHLAMYHNAHSKEERSAENFLLYRDEDPEEETQEEFVERIKLLCQPLRISTSTSG